MNIVPFNNESAIPAYLTTDASFLDINKEVVRAQGFPTLSIKGMKFTITKDGVKRIVTKPDDDDEVAQHLGVVFLRANMNAKTFYMKKYSEGESDNTRPTCYSQDGIEPSSNAAEPQAKKCAICPHNQWGSRQGDGDKEGESKGKACQDNARIAVSAPDNLDPMLLRVPPASLKALREMLKVVAARKVPYNAVVVKVGFDREAPSPKLTFKPIGLLDDKTYAGVRDQYDGEVVRAIVGLDDFGMEPHAPKVEPAVSADELDAALAAREVTQKAAAKPEPVAPKKAAPKPTVDDDELDEILNTKPKAKAKPVVDEDDEPAPPKKAKVEPKPEPKVEAPAKKSGASDLLADLDDLLGNKDD